MPIVNVSYGRLIQIDTTIEVSDEEYNALTATKGLYKSNMTKEEYEILWQKQREESNAFLSIEGRIREIDPDYYDESINVLDHTY